MKNLTHVIMSVLLAALILAFVMKTAMAQDVVKVAPKDL
jgi:hypothetical protein